jgi:hypothetical protein
MGDEDICRLDVAMDDALDMGGIEGIADFEGRIEELVDSQGLVRRGCEPCDCGSASLGKKHAWRKDGESQSAQSKPSVRLGVVRIGPEERRSKLAFLGSPIAGSL